MRGPSGSARRGNDEAQIPTAGICGYQDHLYGVYADHDPKEALKEANANRLARAKFDQAMATNDLVVRHAMLKSVEDDGTAGAALLRYARDVLEAKKRKEVLQANNELKERTRDVKGKRYCAVADAIRAEDPAQGRTLFGLARATRETTTGAGRGGLNENYRENVET